MKYIARFSWPIVLAVIGIVLWVFAALAVIEAFQGSGTSFVGPGEVTVSIAEAGDYRLWHESRTYIDGQFRTFADELPDGTSIRITRQPQGDAVPLRAAGGQMSMETGGTRRVALGRVEFPSAGQYRIAVDGLSDQRAFYLAEVKFFRHFIVGVMFGLLGLALMGGAIAWAVFIVVRSSRRED